MPNLTHKSLIIFHNAVYIVVEYSVPDVGDIYMTSRGCVVKCVAPLEDYKVRLILAPYDPAEDISNKPYYTNTPKKQNS